MKKLFIPFLVLLVFFTLGATLVEASPPRYDVNLSSVFNGNNGVNHAYIDKEYGNKIKLDGSLEEKSGYAFAFWLVDGTVREDLPMDHEFIVKGAMDIRAVFSETTEHAVIFMDSNRNIIDTQYVPDGENAISPMLRQGSLASETFDVFSSGGSSYDNGEYESEGLVWDYQGVRGDLTLDGTAFTFGKGDSNHLKSSEIPGGISSFSFDAVHAFSGSQMREVSLFVNGEAVESFDITDTVETYKVDGLGVSGAFSLELRNTGGERVTVDNFNWKRAGVTLPDKPAFIIDETTPWDGSLESITEDKVLTLQYQLDTTDTYTVSIDDDSGVVNDEHSYNSVVNAKASVHSGDLSFSHWESDGKVLSFDQNYAFSVLEDRSIKAIYQSSPEVAEPIINISDGLNLRDGHISYLAQFEFPSDYELMDFGLVASSERRDIEMHESGVTKYTGTNYEENTNEFLISLKENHETVRGYLVLENSAGTKNTYYTPYVDTTSPTLEVSESEIALFEGQSFSPVEDVSVAADDNFDGDLTDSVTYSVIDGEGAQYGQPVDFTQLTEGNYDVVYSVSDEAGNSISHTLNLNIQIDTTPPSLDAPSGYTHGQGDTLDPLTDLALSAEDNADGSLTPSITYTLEDQFGESLEPGDFSSLSVGAYTLRFSVKDSTGNSVQATTNFDVVEESPVETIYYTGFENDSIDFYSSNQTDTIDSLEWESNNVATAAYANQDRFIGNQALRINSGLNSFIHTYEAFDNVDSFKFEAVTTAMDDTGAVIEVSISTDKTNWISLSEETLTDEYQTFEYFIDYESLKDITYQDGIYIKIEQVQERINIDDFYIYGTGSSKPGDDEPTSPEDDEPTSPEEPISNDLETLLNEDLIPYFDEAEGIYGDQLENSLQTILNRDVKSLSYDDAKWVLEESDRDPDNENNIILVYTRDSVKGQWDYPNWNREHVWPQSKLASSGAKEDVHHLKPSDVQENSSRGNLPFGTTGSTYEPPDEVKGDIARIVFYMDARYPSLNISSSTIGDLSTLLEWHEQDPVDSFEMNRNSVIYKHQKNRNPFIDHPHLAWLMYHDHPSVDLQ